MPSVPRPAAFIDGLLAVRGNRTYYAVSAAVALLYIFSLFPVDFFLGTNPFWFDVRTDPTQHVTGLWAFLADDWRFPLLYTTYLNYPQGVSAAYADIIPLAALLFKPVAALFPPHTHYFGVWVFLSYLLQGIAGAYFVGNAREKTVLFAVGGTLMALMMPSLLIRIPHSALLMQSLLIFALAFYYLAMQGRMLPAKATRYQGGLLLAAALIHPYFLAMLYPIYVATHAALVIASKRRWRSSLSEIPVVTLLIFVLLWIVGYISFQSSVLQPATGFDVNSMNLLSPFLGTHLAGSVFLPSEKFTLDATGLQIDGHNYLGVSVLFMIAWALLVRPKRTAHALRRHSLMVLLLAAFTLYALSTKIYAADTLLLQYRLPHFMDGITGTFRSSGRFFWPVGYALLFGAFFMFTDACKRTFLVLCVTAVVAVQYIDTAPHRAYLYEAAHRTPYFKVRKTTWDTLVEHSRRVYLFPTYGCGADYIDPLMLQYFSTAHRKPYNTGFVARARAECALKEKALGLPKEDGDLFVFSANKFPETRIKEAMGTHLRQWCRMSDIGTVCKIGATDAEWKSYNGENAFHSFPPEETP